MILSDSTAVKKIKSQLLYAENYLFFSQLLGGPADNTVSHVCSVKGAKANFMIVCNRCIRVRHWEESFNAATGCDVKLCGIIIYM